VVHRMEGKLCLGLLFIVLFKGLDTAPAKDIYNVKSKYYRSSPGELDEEDFSYIITDEDPTTDAEIESYIQRHGLHHGDVVNFDEYRESAAKIVVYDSATGKYKFAANPDDSDAGYLTIPAEVLAHVTDFKTKYEEVMHHIQDYNEIVNFHVSPNDKFIVDKFGKVPVGYEFDVYFDGGEYLDTFAVSKVGKNTWYDFDYDTVTWQEIEDYFKAMEEEQAKFTIKVALKGQELTRYKDKYAGSGRYDWLRAKPTLPTGWRVERGQSSMGMTEMKWDWKFSGPKSAMQQAKESAKKFLDGFTYSFV